MEREIGDVGGEGFISFEFSKKSIVQLNGYIYIYRGGKECRWSVKRWFDVLDIVWDWNCSNWEIGCGKKMRRVIR